jgi:[NiFe] hydrogenase diaphorase moiety large subunit
MAIEQGTAMSGLTSSQRTKQAIAEIARSVGNDRTRLMDVLIAANGRLGYLSDETLVAIAAELGVHYVEVLDTASFYAFFSRTPQGTHAIRFSRTPISLMKGAAAVVAAFEAAVGARIGTTSADGIALSWTSDIGMADQEPACLINGAVFTNLVPADAAPIVAQIRTRTDGATSALPGYPSTPAIVFEKAGCSAIIVERGPVLLAPSENGAGLRNALALTPDRVIAEVTKSGLRGRGGAGFSTGLKWRMTRASKADAHYTICNADEGEPGTFKDRVLLSEAPDLVIEGMTIAAYALGATTGFVYLRAEYAFLFAGLERVLACRRELGLLGKNISGRTDFDFDIRIQLGAGAYICGEESSLMESLEGKRGTPRDKPPYPTDHGYLGKPTAVNNVETLACVTRILENGASWFAQFGTAESKGTKLMCLSGDCAKPGVYEVPFGISLYDLLERAGGTEAQAVQISGAAGECIAPKDFGRGLAYEDLSTAGATMVFGPQRDLLSAVLQFAEFFADESCGWCTPCRVGTVLLRDRLQRTLDGRSSYDDIAQLEGLATFVSKFSRCGLGQMAPTPILTTLRNFPHIYESRLVAADATRIDVAAAIARGETSA